MTKLDKPVTRRTPILLDSRETPRPCDHVAVTLYPNGTISFRASGARTSYTLPLSTCYRLAMTAELNAKKKGTRRK